MVYIYLFRKIVIISLLFSIFSAEPLWDFMDADYGCRTGFIRRLFMPITLSQKGRIYRKYTSSRCIKRDSRPLHLIKPNRIGKK